VPFLPEMGDFANKALSYEYDGFSLVTVSLHDVNYCFSASNTLQFYVVDLYTRAYVARNLYFREVFWSLSL
jgi:hypothetical protein